MGEYSRAIEDPDVEAIRLDLSYQRENCDECQELAEYDGGAGPGVYSLDSCPATPIHPNCACMLTPVYRLPDGVSADDIDEVDEDTDTMEPLPDTADAHDEDYSEVEGDTSQSEDQGEGDASDDISEISGMATNNLREAFSRGEVDSDAASDILASMNSYSEVMGKGAKFPAISIVDPSYAEQDGWVAATTKSGEHMVISSEFTTNLSSVSEILADNADGFHPKGCDTLKSTIDHEFGHKIAIDKKASILRYFEDHGIDFTEDQIISGLSEYAATSIDEFLAEGYSEYVNNPHPRPIAKLIGDLMTGRKK
jgi:hypothetical protein